MKLQIYTESNNQIIGERYVLGRKYTTLDITETRAKELIEMLLNDPPNLTGALCFNNQAICAVVQSGKKITDGAVESWKREQRDEQARQRHQKLGA